MAKRRRYWERLQERNSRKQDPSSDHRRETELVWAKRAGVPEWIVDEILMMDKRKPSISGELNIHKSLVSGALVAYCYADDLSIWIRLPDADHQQPEIRVNGVDFGESTQRWKDHNLTARQCSTLSAVMDAVGEFLQADPDDGSARARFVLDGDQVSVFARDTGCLMATISPVQGGHDLRDPAVLASKEKNEWIQAAWKELFRLGKVTLTPSGD